MLVTFPRTTHETPLFLCPKYDFSLAASQVFLIVVAAFLFSLDDFSRFMNCVWCVRVFRSSRLLILNRNFRVFILIIVCFWSLD